MPGIGMAATVVRRLLIRHTGQGPPLPLQGFWLLLAIVVVCHMLAYSGAWKRLAVRLPAPVLGLGYGALVCLIMLLAPDAGKAFLYFDF